MPSEPWPDNKKDWIKRHDEESNLPYNEPKEPPKEEKPKDKK